MADGGATNRGQPLTTGWKVGIVAALLIAAGNTGVSSLRGREEERHQNHERRIDALENKIRELQAAIDGQVGKVPGKRE
jgi:hypothetical protein